MLGIRTPVLTFAQQVLYPLSHVFKFIVTVIITAPGTTHGSVTETCVSKGGESSVLEEHGTVDSSSA